MSQALRPFTGRIIALVAIVLAQIVSSGPANATLTVFDWFRLSAGVIKEWDLVTLPERSDLVRIKPKRYLSSQPLRRVLVMYPRRSSAYDTAMTTILNVMADKRLNADFTVINFQIDDSRGKAALEYAEASNFDLILSMGSETTAWLWQHYRGGKLPVVTVCSKDPVLLGQATGYDQGSGTNFAFTSLNMPIDAQMSYVMQLRPNLKNLAILVDANNVSAVQTQSVPAREYMRTRGVRVIDIAVQNPARVKQELAQQVRDAVNTMRKNDVDLTNSLFWITGSTLLFTEMATINEHAFRVPVLSTVIDVVLPGDDSAVLAVGISFESNAHQAAIYAADVIEGRKPVGAMHVGVVSPPDVAVSFRKAREIGMRIPFSFFESATTLYDNDGKLVRSSSLATPAAVVTQSSVVTTSAPMPSSGAVPAQAATTPVPSVPVEGEPVTAKPSAPVAEAPSAAAETMPEAAVAPAVPPAQPEKPAPARSGRQRAVK
jgi:putative ABC transport system substrate-binding protein